MTGTLTRPLGEFRIGSGVPQVKEVEEPSVDTAIRRYALVTGSVARLVTFSSIRLSPSPELSRLSIFVFLRHALATTPDGYVLIKRCQTTDRTRRELRQLTSRTFFFFTQHRGPWDRWLQWRWFALLLDMRLELGLGHGVWLIDDGDEVDSHSGEPGVVAWSLTGQCDGL